MTLSSISEHRWMCFWVQTAGRGLSGLHVLAVNEDGRFILRYTANCSSKKVATPLFR